MISRYLITVVLLLLAAGALRAQGEGNDAPRSSPLEGLEKIEPAGSRSEADDDRRAARVHFLQARLDLGRDDKAAALRHYQRAWRWDPQQPELLREIASLAFELKRGEEAARYAVLAAEHDPQDALLMRRLAAILTKGRDWSRAIRLYELAERMESRRRKPDGKPDLSELTIRLEMGRLYFLTGDFEKSAAAFAVIRDALLDSDSELSADARELLVGKPGETWALWAEAFLSARRFDEAEALFRKSHEARADAATLAFQLARVAAQRGDAAAAIARLDEYFAERSSVAGIEPYDLLAELNAKRLPDKAAARQATIDRLAKLAKDDGDNLALKRALAG
ncbi:MAG TPA: hypothetical protein VFV87_20650, partial [Pirellulaceae bacterium]|nr:hypothetical protein [Pirellulaceae bacterium]